MNVNDLIKRLSQIDGDREVYTLDKDGEIADEFFIHKDIINDIPSILISGDWYGEE